MKRGSEPQAAGPARDGQGEALGLDVEVLDKGGVGELRIRYATLEQLDELCRKLTRV